MIRLLGSEWSRFWSRRILRWLTVLAVVGILIGGVIAGATSHPSTAAGHAAAEHHYERWVKRCIRNGGFGDKVPEGTSLEEHCRGMVSVSSFENTNQIRLDAMPEIVQGAAFLVIILGLMLGASMVGASWQTGTITTILTWEPRRIRWFLTRAVVIFAGVLLLALALLAILTLAIAAASALRGSTDTAPGWFGETARSALRVAAVAAAASLIGAGVAMLGRNTAAALGAIFGYLVLFEALVQGLRPWVGKYLLGQNIGAFITGQSIEMHGSYTITPGHGITVLVVYASVLMAVGTLALRTRDVN